MLSPMTRPNELDTMGLSSKLKRGSKNCGEIHQDWLDRPGLKGCLSRLKVSLNRKNLSTS